MISPNKYSDSHLLCSSVEDEGGGGFPIFPSLQSLPSSSSPLLHPTPDNSAHHIFVSYTKENFRPSTFFFLEKVSAWFFTENSK